MLLLFGSQLLQSAGVAADKVDKVARRELHVLPVRVVEVDLVLSEILIPPHSEQQKL